MTTNQRAVFARNFLENGRRQTLAPGKKKAFIVACRTAQPEIEKTETDRIIVEQEEMGSPQDIRKTGYI